MGSKKKAQPKKKKQARKSQKSKAVAKLRTPFMAAFTAQFIRDPATRKQKFVNPGDSDLQQFANFADVLKVLGEKIGLGNPAPDGTGSLRDRVIAFLLAQQWPDHTAIPQKFKGRSRTVHLVEMAVIADRMLEAINEGFGGGGGPSGWPPH